MTLLLTIALVVGVIFVFLRSLWATVIPSVTVPLSLLGACALMYLAGYSLDNLSLMALTISVGFVVDDAIVMLENIVRHIEDGMRPLEAALIGAGEIGFTILSISLSLIAVFIPLLLMGGIIGRLFREFAVTVTMTIAVSAFVALTLTPMMCSRFLEARQGREARPALPAHRARLRRAARRLRAALDVVLRHQFTTLMVFFATLACTVVSVHRDPEGLLPAAGHRPHHRHLGSRAGRLLRRDDAAAGGARRHRRRGPGRRHLRHGHRRRRLVGGAQQRPLLHHAEAEGRARRLGRRDHRPPARRKLDKIEGAKLFLQAAQDVNVGGRAARTQFQYTLQDADIDELNAWAPKVLDKLKTLPELRDVATDQQMAGTTLTARHQPRSGLALRPHAAGDRRHALRRLRPAPGRAVLHAAEQLSRRHGGAARAAGRPGQPRQDLHPLAGDRQLVPLAAFATWTTRKTQPLSISHQGQFPAVTISFNLAQGVSLGTATQAIHAAERELQLPPSLRTSFQGNAQAFQHSLRTVPLLIGAALVVIYLILGILYESYIHPITILSTLPSAGAGALATLMLFGYDFSLVAMIGVILLIGIVKKNGIMLVDFAIHAEQRSTCRRRRRSARRRCCASGRS